jgi:hypothetical protein
VLGARALVEGRTGRHRAVALRLCLPIDPQYLQRLGGLVEDGELDLPLAPGPRLRLPLDQVVRPVLVLMQLPHLVRARARVRVTVTVGVGVGVRVTVTVTVTVTVRTASGPTSSRRRKLSPVAALTQAVAVAFPRGAALISAEELAVESASSGGSGASATSMAGSTAASPSKKRDTAASTLPAASSSRAASSRDWPVMATKSATEPSGASTTSAISWRGPEVLGTLTSFQHRLEFYCTHKWDGLHTRHLLESTHTTITTSISEL